MDIEFQDRIDEYLLRGDLMDDGEKARFMQELEDDPEKKRQYELTKNLREALESRRRKLDEMAVFENARHRLVPDRGAGRRLSALTVAAGIAAVIGVGLFYAGMETGGKQPGETVRGDDGVFGPAPADSADWDSALQMSESILKNYPKPLKR